MITFFSPAQALHAPEHEFFRGERVACHETPQRATFVLDALRQRGHALREPDHDAVVVLQRVHTPRYLAFLASAWAQWLGCPTVFVLEGGYAAKEQGKNAANVLDGFEGG